MENTNIIQVQKDLGAKKNNIKSEQKPLKQKEENKEKNVTFKCSYLYSGSVSSENASIAYKHVLEEARSKK